MNDDLPATRIIRQSIIPGSSVRVVSFNAPFPLLDSSIILLKLELSRESPRRYAMCLFVLIALCRSFLKLMERHANYEQSPLSGTQLSDNSFYSA